MQKVIEEQGAYYYLDSPPITITSKENRPPYSDDGNYFSKPNIEIIFDSIYEILRNFNLKKFPFIY
jgi:2-oxoisovalerate dehydrogenase E1 component